VHVPGSSSVSSAFSHVERWIGFPLLSANTIFRGTLFEAAAISLCSGLTVCSPHRSFPPLQLSPQGGRGFYVRAERASLPPHASELLSARLQAIGGTRTLTSQDSQHCRLLIPLQHPLHLPAGVFSGWAKARTRHHAPRADLLWRGESNSQHPAIRGGIRQVLGRHDPSTQICQPIHCAPTRRRS